MTPADLKAYLNNLLSQNLLLSTMIWGPPGIGKSSIVAQLARKHQIDFIDVRLSQLAPTDLRGLPVPENGVSKWYPPEFLPSSGRGILFLDELNMAPPAMQGVAQQLILDRRVGSYCYDDQTRVMTQNGLKYFRDLNQNDEVMTLNPYTKLVEYQKPQQYIELDYQGEMLHFRGRGVSLCVSPEHRMYVRSKYRSEFEVMTAAELASGPFFKFKVKKNGNWYSYSDEKFTVPIPQRAKERIEVYDRIQALLNNGVSPSGIAVALKMTQGQIDSRLYYGKNPRKSYNLDLSFDMMDWVTFLGWYLSEGSCSKAHNYRVTISQSKSANPDKYTRIEVLLQHMKLSYQATESGFTICSVALYDYLAPLGKSKTKYIPQDVKALPKPYLQTLLNVMLAGDGDSNRKYYTASDRLRDDFCEIAIKLGYGVTFSKRQGSGYSSSDNFTWVVNLNHKNIEPVIAKLERVAYSGRIYCITVPNHIIMVERDGKLAWCGNCVPEGWFIWAAGNRKEDRAAVFDMPSPLANRFLHLHVEPDFQSFKSYALSAKIHEQIIAFLSFRTTLLHKLDPQQPAWPSPRSWEMASQLHTVGLDIAPAVGIATAAEFNAYIKLYDNLPNLTQIFTGRGDAIKFPSEPSVRYATTIGLAIRAADANQAYNAFTWISQVAAMEWVQLFATDLFRTMRSKKQIGALAQLVQKDENLQKFIKDFQELMGL